MRIGRVVPLLAAAASMACEAGSTAPAVPDEARFASAAGPAVAAAADGGAHWTVPPSLFGFEVGNKLTFNGRKMADGTVTGRIDYHQSFLGNDIHLNARLTCLEVYDGGTRVKYGGVVTVSNDPGIVPGELFIWFQGIDNGQGAGAPPDRSTIAGAGDEAANEAFCASDAPPRNIFDVQGQIAVAG